MTRLDAALERFRAALDALESSVSAAGEGQFDAAETSALAEEVAALKQERDELLARFAVLEEESESLAGATEAVETRLDGAIAEIRSALRRS